MDVRETRVRLWGRLSWSLTLVLARREVGGENRDVIWVCDYSVALIKDVSALASWEAPALWWEEMMCRVVDGVNGLCLVASGFAGWRMVGSVESSGGLDGLGGIDGQDS